MPEQQILRAVNNIKILAWHKIRIAFYEFQEFRVLPPKVFEGNGPFGRQVQGFDKFIEHFAHCFNVMPSAFTHREHSQQGIEHAPV